MEPGNQGNTTNVTLQRRPAIDRKGDGQNSAESMQNQFVNRPDAIPNQKQGANQSAQDLHHSQQISTGQRGRGRGNGMGGLTTSGRRRQYNSHTTSRRGSTTYKRGQGHTRTNPGATLWQAPGATSSPGNTLCASQRPSALVSIIETYNKNITTRVLGFVETLLLSRAEWQARLKVSSSTSSMSANIMICKLFSYAQLVLLNLELFRPCLVITLRTQKKKLQPRGTEFSG